MTDLSDDERAALTVTLAAFNPVWVPNDCDTAIWRAAGRYYLAMAADACLAEKVDAEDTGEESDRAYNNACDDCANAIRPRIEGTTA